MNRTIGLLLICTAFIVLAGCDANVSKDNAPTYERVAGEVEGLPEESAPQVPDLAPLEKAVQDEPDNPDARFVYMNGLQRSGKIPEALEQARILLGMDGDHTFKAVTYLNLAYMVLDDISPDDPSRADLLKEAYDGMWIALGIEPESIPAHTTYGRLALELGEDDKAVHHLSIALSVDEIGYKLRTDLGRIYLKKGDMQKARVHLETARTLATEAGDKEALRGISNLIEKLG